MEAASDDFCELDERTFSQGDSEAPCKQTNLFFRPALEKQDNDAIVEAFQKRLKDVAGFEFVPPMRNRNKAVVYYLFLASPRAVAKKIIEEIFAKYRF